MQVNRYRQNKDNVGKVCMLQKVRLIWKVKHKNNEFKNEENDPKYMHGCYMSTPSLIPRSARPRLCSSLKLDLSFSVVLTVDPLQVPCAAAITPRDGPSVIMTRCLVEDSADVVDIAC